MYNLELPSKRRLFGDSPVHPSSFNLTLWTGNLEPNFLRKRSEELQSYIEQLTSIPSVQNSEEVTSKSIFNPKSERTSANPGAFLLH